MPSHLNKSHVQAFIEKAARDGLGAVNQIDPAVALQTLITAGGRWLRNRKFRWQVLQKLQVFLLAALERAEGAMGCERSEPHSSEAIASSSREQSQPFLLDASGGSSFDLCEHGLNGRAQHSKQLTRAKRACTKQLNS